VLIGGCASPIRSSAEDDLRASIVQSLRREVEAAEAHPDAKTVTSEPGIDQLGIDPQRYPELEAMAGPEAYDLDPGALPLDSDLLGQEQGVAAIGLRHAVQTAIENNLQAQFARLSPAVAEAQIVSAEAAFDWTLFANTQFSRTDEPQQARSAGGFPIGVTATNRDSTTVQTGFRRSLRTGGSLTLQQEFVHSDDNSPQTVLLPDPATQVSLTLQFDQPLLRNFGTDASMAQVYINRNAERNAVQDLKRTLIDTATQTEQAYWELYGAHRDLLILERLLKNGIAVRDQVKERRILDATPAQIADAVARVEERRANVLRARTALRIASDKLKQLMNDPRFPVGDETLLIPADDALDEPVEVSLLDAIMTAVENRPEVQQAILSIDDSSIRKALADNQRLPKLDMRLQAQLSELDRGTGEAFRDEWQGRFVDYLAGLFFEQPIGNRDAEGEARRRRLERMQAVISYRNTIQQIVLELKSAVRNLALNYELIPQTTRSRVAATEVLRALIVEEDTIGSLTVERLDLKLTRQESLARAERAEVQALVDYNSALADYYAAIGKTLERSRVEFVVPDPSDVIDRWGNPRNE